MDPEVVVKFFTPKLLGGKRGEDIKQFIMKHFNKELFGDGLVSDRSLEDQGVSLESIRDYSLIEEEILVRQFTRSL